MSQTLSILLSLTLLFLTASAQQVSTPQPSATAQVTNETPDSAAIDALLRIYEKAYNHQNMDELLAIWPDLKNDKKQFQKIKGEFSRADVSEINVSMQVQQILPAGNDELLVHCTRSEQYKKMESSLYASGDNMMGAIPAQNPGPTKLTDKKLVHKTADAWVALRKSGTTWKIISLSDKKPR